VIFGVKKAIRGSGVCANGVEAKANAIARNRAGRSPFAVVKAVEAAITCDMKGIDPLIQYRCSVEHRFVFGS